MYPFRDASPKLSINEGIIKWCMIWREWMELFRSSSISKRISISGEYAIFKMAIFKAINCRTIWLALLVMIGMNLICFYMLARRPESIISWPPKKNERYQKVSVCNLPAQERRLRKNFHGATRIQVKSVGRWKINLTAVGPYSGFLFYFSSSWKTWEGWTKRGGMQVTT